MGDAGAAGTVVGSATEFGAPLGMTATATAPGVGFGAGGAAASTSGGKIKNKAHLFAGADIRSVRMACEFSVGEYRVLQSRARTGDPASDRRLRSQYDAVVSDLYVLRGEVAAAVKATESHRWRRWLLGGLA